MGRGNVFGEMSVITARPRSADVVAQTPLEVAFIDRSSLMKLMKGQPAIACKLLFNLCRLMAERTQSREGQWMGTLLIVLRTHEGASKLNEQKVFEKLHFEPPRLSRRPHNLRGWGNGNIKAVFSGSPGACGADGGGAPA